MKFIVLVLLGLSLAAGSGASLEARPQQRGTQMLQNLDLSEAQSEQIQEIRKANRGEMKASRRALRASRKALRKALQSDASDDALRAQFESVQDLRAKIGKQRFEQMLKIRSVLTPEQRKDFRGMRGDKRGKRRGRSNNY